MHGSGKREERRAYAVAPPKELSLGLVSLFDNDNHNDAIRTPTARPPEQPQKGEKKKKTLW